MSIIKGCPRFTRFRFERVDLKVKKELCVSTQKNIFLVFKTIHVSLRITQPTLCDKTSLLTNCYFTRHSTMLVGQTGSGKSVCWKILQASMTRLKRDGDSSFNIVRVSLRNRQRIYTEDMWRPNGFNSFNILCSYNLLFRRLSCVDFLFLCFIL